MVFGTGCIVLTINGLAFLLKFFNLLSVLVCPSCIMGMKLRCKKLPLDYEHYNSEFDFEARLESKVDICDQITHKGNSHNNLQRNQANTIGQK